MENDITVMQAIIAIDPLADVRLEGNEYNIDIIKIDFSSTEISRADIKTKMVELQTEHDAQEYARNRALSYDSIGNQLDLLFHDMTAGKGTKTGEWYKAVAKVKSDNPKA
jgi:hypothetical protein